MAGKDEVLMTPDGQTFKTWSIGVPSLMGASGIAGGAHCQVTIDDNLIFVAGGWINAEVKSGIVSMKISRTSCK